MTIRAVLLLVVSIGWWRVPLTGPDVRADIGKAAASAAALLIVLAALATPLLGLLDVDKETFRMAAGLVVIVIGAARTLGFGRRRENGDDAVGWLLPLMYPVLIGPETVLLGLSVGADHGIALVAAGAIGGAVLSMLALRISGSDRFASAATRAAGVAMMTLGVALVFDGLRDI